MVISCRDLSFDQELSRGRCARACTVLGDAVVRRIVGFALYLMGTTRSSIGRSLGMPEESVKTLMKKLQRDGLGALEDRRRSQSSFLPPRVIEPGDVGLQREDTVVLIDLGDLGTMRLPAGNALQVRTVVLSLCDAGLVKAKKAAEVLQLSEEHVRSLVRRLRQDDAIGLCDQRKGQQQDYRFPSELKAELIQQYAAHAVTGRSVASSVVTEELNKRENWSLSDRSVRHHIRKLGLQRIGRSLPQLVEELKKNSAPS